MASIASTSTTPQTLTTVADPRPQAGPLPSKRGEIGYKDGGGDLESRSTEGDSRSPVALPPRHPADRDHDEVVVADNDVQPESAVTGAIPSPPDVEVPGDTLSVHSNGKRSIISFFTSRNVPTVGGIRLTTLFIFIGQLLFAGGTIVAWVFVVRRINQSSKHLQDGDPQDGSMQLSSSAIFIHIILAIILLGQLIFIERQLFFIRAECYSHLHPGEMLPTSRRTSTGTISIAPWHRPSLPTYAATLAQSGHGTGDVEDNVIAVPPPPAYGNNRGSRLLLQGYLRDSLRAQRPISEHSQSSQRNERPISYSPHDEEWKEVQDAEVARQLEDALSKLQERDVGLYSMESSSAMRRDN